MKECVLAYTIFYCVSWFPFMREELCGRTGLDWPVGFWLMTSKVTAHVVSRVIRPFSLPAPPLLKRNKVGKNYSWTPPLLCSVNAASARSSHAGEPFPVLPSVYCWTMIRMHTDQNLLGSNMCVLNVKYMWIYLPSRGQLSLTSTHRSEEENADKTEYRWCCWYFSHLSEV